MTGHLLRAPPFPTRNASISHPQSGGEEYGSNDVDAKALFAHIRDARVGGAFWAEPAALAHPAGTVMRPRQYKEAMALLETHGSGGREATLCILPGEQERPRNNHIREHSTAEGCEWRYGEFDPWSVLDTTQCLVAHGDDEWVALARIAQIPVRLLSAGRFGKPGDDNAALDRIVARHLAHILFRDPFTGSSSTIESSIDLLAEWRRILDVNLTIVAACGMAWWKRAEIRQFLWSPQRKLRLTSRPRPALKMAQRHGGAIAIWPSRVSPDLIDDAQRTNVPLVRIEDGFVRSVGLGVDLVPPSSIVVDRFGIHYDPSKPSELEHILATTRFSPRLVNRAKLLRETIVSAGISKYAAGSAGATPKRQNGRKLVLVPGQVADDMSVLAGANGLNNLDLLRRVRELEPDAEIWFRPHPDVDAGHRAGSIADAEALAYADYIARGTSMAELLNVVDAVHVLTSLTGFEALLRGRQVTCHGTPFYAGWGLTQDLGAVPERRDRALSLDELTAGVLILYPRYLDPVTELPCPPEVLVNRMATKQAINRLGWVAPLRRWQGKLMAALR